MELTKPGLDILQPAWKDRAPASVDALFTCRDGGVSSGAYGNAEGIMGLNVAPHTGDFGACVRMNRSIVAQLVPSDPVWLRQVHGTEVVDADTAEGEPEADASVSTKPGVVCTVMTADCLPVLLANREGTVVAAVHAGWKSLAAGIIGKTIRVMRERPPKARVSSPGSPRASVPRPSRSARTFARRCSPVSPKPTAPSRRAKATA